MGVLLLALFSGEVDAASGTIREIRGIVTAINVEEHPSVIMVVAKRPGGADVVVGAVVPEQAAIRRGDQSVSLKHLHVGETVTLRYVKERTGLRVQSIQVHQ